MSTITNCVVWLFRHILLGESSYTMSFERVGELDGVDIKIYLFWSANRNRGWKIWWNLLGFLWSITSWHRGFLSFILLELPQSRSEARFRCRIKGALKQPWIPEFQCLWRYHLIIFTSGIGVKNGNWSHSMNAFDGNHLIFDLRSWVDNARCFGFLRLDLGSLVQQLV